MEKVEDGAVVVRTGRGLAVDGKRVEVEEVVACPACNAPKGQYCVEPTADPRAHHTHVERIRAAYTLAPPNARSPHRVR